MNKYSLTQFNKAIDSFANKKIAVIGDLILDAYTWGKVTRISPEAPVPVVQVTRRSRCLGGAANVMRNIISLGGNAVAFGVVGNDLHGKDLCKLLEDGKINTYGIFTDNERTTTFKERVIAGSQQLLRLDDEQQTAISSKILQQLFDRFVLFLKNEQPDAVILEDYAKGLFNKENAQNIVNICNKLNIPVTLDPKPSNPLNLHGLTIMKPNCAEAFALAGIPQPIEKTDILTLEKVAAKIQELWQVKYLLISLAEDGMALFQQDHKYKIIPTRAREVFDVSGAGDTVIAAATLALCSTNDPELSAELANYAAGVVVGKLGTATVNITELRNSFLN